MKAYCDKEKIKDLLDGRKLKWLVEKINESGVEIQYATFNLLLNSKAEWKLTYAMVTAKVLNVSVEDIFILK